MGFSAPPIFIRATWVMQPLSDYGVPRSWWSWLGAAKAAGAVGLLASLSVLVIGALAGIGLCCTSPGSSSP
ncbi:DoxX family protein [Streptosporangium canum]|uniref:DoxX family protein n=1 Tax=Streptosporangium canum TaxID=324952 RepID=UPI003414C7B0